MTQVLPGPVTESCGKVFTCITVTIEQTTTSHHHDNGNIYIYIESKLNGYYRYV
jgi:hypothetical protein